MKISTFLGIAIFVFAIVMYVIKKPPAYDLRKAEDLAYIESMIMEQAKDRQFINIYIGSNEDSLLSVINLRYKDEKGEEYSITRRISEENWQDPVKNSWPTASEDALKFINDKIKTFSPELLDLSSLPEKFDRAIQTKTDEYENFNVENWFISSQKTETGEIIPSLSLNFSGTKIGGERRRVKRGVRVESAQFKIDFGAGLSSE